MNIIDTSKERAEQKVQLQEVYDKVAAHLLKQGRQSAHNFFCMYRDGKGNMCAVGCLIKDEHYNAEFEGIRMADEAVKAALIASGIPVEDELSPMYEMLRHLQDMHDNFGSILQWPTELRLIAEYFNLFPYPRPA